jgi:RHS repeat-associated protein
LACYYEDKFRQLGQYEDVETRLYYNRFRYYKPETGLYISQDPIGLAGNNPNFYAYVHDSNVWVDYCIQRRKIFKQS